MWLQGLRRLQASNVSSRAVNAVLTRVQWQQLQQQQAGGGSAADDAQAYRLWQQQGGEGGQLGYLQQHPGAVAALLGSAGGVAPQPVLEELQHSLEQELKQQHGKPAIAAGRTTDQHSAQQQQQQQQQEGVTQASTTQQQQQQQQLQQQQHQSQDDSTRATAAADAAAETHQPSTSHAAAQPVAQQQQHTHQGQRSEQRAKQQPARPAATSSRGGRRSGNGGGGANAAAGRGVGSLNERQLTAYITQQLYGNALRDMRSQQQQQGVGHCNTGPPPRPGMPPRYSTALPGSGMGPPPAPSALPSPTTASPCRAPGGGVGGVRGVRAIEGYIRGAGCVLDNNSRLNTIHLAALLTRLAYLVREAQLPSGVVRELPGLPQLLSRCQALFPELAPSLDHQSHTNLLWACAKLGQRPDPAFITGVLDALQRVGFSSVRPQGLANTLWALATIGPAHYQAPPETIRQLIAAVEDKAGSFCSQDISNCLWSLATLAGGCASHLEPPCPMQAAGGSPWQGGGNSHYTISTQQQQQSSSACRPPAHVLDRVAAAALNQLEEFTPQGVANTLWALAKLDYSPLKGDLLRAMLSYVSLHLAAFPPQELVNSVWAAGHLHMGQLPQGLLQRLEAHAAQHLPSYLPLQVSALLTSFSQVGYCPRSPRFLEGLRCHLLRTLGSHRAQELANSMLALGTLRLDPGDDVLHAMRDRQAELVASGACRTQTLAAFLYGLAMLRPNGMDPQDLLAAQQYAAATAASAQQQQHGGGNGSAGAAAGCGQAELEQMYVLARLAGALPASGVDGGAGGDAGGELVAAMRHAWLARPAQRAQRARCEDEVVGALRALGLAPLRSLQASEGLAADVALLLQAQDSPSVSAGGAVGTCVALQVCGVGDYCSNAPHVLRGERALEHHLLQADGWTVIEVPAHEWSSLDATHRLLMLAERLGATLPAAGPTLQQQGAKSASQQQGVEFTSQPAAPFSEPVWQMGPVADGFALQQQGANFASQQQQRQAPRADILLQPAAPFSEPVWQMGLAADGFASQKQGANFASQKQQRQAPRSDALLQPPAPFSELVWQMGPADGGFANPQPAQPWASRIASDGSWQDSRVTPSSGIKQETAAEWLDRRHLEQQLQQQSCASTTTAGARGRSDEEYVALMLGATLPVDMALAVLDDSGNHHHHP